jgi:hypothetical protein
MPRTAEDVENYLLSLDRRFENDGGTYLLASAGQNSSGTTVAVRVSPPIVAFRVIIGPLPKETERQLELFRKLLEYNASDLMHVSYGLDAPPGGGHDTVVLSGALELENLDMNEVEAMLSDIDLALARHVPSLRQITMGTSPSSAPVGQDGGSPHTPGQDGGHPHTPGRSA